MEFFEAKAFTEHLKEYLKDDQYRELQTLLLLNPIEGDIIQGTGGFRKLRWADQRRGKRKRGGLRVIYYYFEGTEQIWMLTIYDKNTSDDLSPAQRKMLKLALDKEKKERRLL